MAARAPDSQEFLAGAASAFIGFGAVGALLLCLVGLVVEIVGAGAASTATVAVFGLIGLAFWSDQVALYHTAVLAGLRRFGIVNALLLGSVCWRAAGAFALLEAGASVVVIAAWYAMSAAVWAAVNTVVVRLMYPAYRMRPGLRDLEPLRSRVRFGTDSLLVMLAIGATWNAGTLLVAGLKGAAASALFQVSQRFPLATQALPDRIAATLFPAAGAPSAAGADRAQWLIASGTRLTMLALTPIAVIFLAAPGDILSAWLGDIPPDGPTLMRLATVAVLAHGLSASAVQVLWARGVMRPLTSALYAGAVVAVGGGALLTVMVGRVGAAVGLAAGVSLSAALVLAAAAAATGARAAAPVAPVLRDLGVPTAACALAAASATVLAPAHGWYRVAIIAGCGSLAYAVGIALVARDWPERSLLRGMSALGGLRSLSYLALAARDAALASRRRTRGAALAAYDNVTDPWGYSTNWGDTHLDRIEMLVAAATPNGKVPRALDIGCGEGQVTERILPCCRELLAVDVSDTALERARRRCAFAGNVRFERWDVLDEQPLGEFDLILALGVFEVFRRPSLFRRAQRRIVSMLAPGGALLVTTTKQSPVVEKARWAQVLPRGARPIEALLASDDALQREARAETETHLITLYRRVAKDPGVH